jgi:hypothetical protein
MITEAPAYQDQENHRQLSYCDLYVINDVDSGLQIRLTSFDRNITIGGVLPTGWQNGTFTRQPCTHDDIKLDSETTTQGVAFSIQSNHPIFIRYFQTAPTTRITIDIYRCTNVDTPDFAQDIFYSFAGELNGCSFQDNTYTGTFTAVALNLDRPVPRVFYQRRCNHDLYGPGCKVDSTAHTWTGNIITGFNRYSKQINLTTFDNISAGLFTSGYLVEPQTQSKIGIIVGKDGVGAARVIYTAYWIPELELVGAELTLVEGCPRTIPGCKRFDNLPNFLGMPKIPVQNPSIDGVA